MRRLICVGVVALAVACGDSTPAADPARICAIDVQLDQFFTTFERSPSQAREAATRARELLNESVEVAPVEIRTPMESARRSYFRFLDVLERADFDVTRADQAELAVIFEDEDWQTAGSSIEAWIAANCSQ